MRLFWRDIIGIFSWKVAELFSLWITYRRWDLLSKGHLPRESGESCCGVWNILRWGALHILGLRECPLIRILLMVRAEMIILASSYSKLRCRCVLLHSRWYNGNVAVSEVGVLCYLCGGCFQLHGWNLYQVENMYRCAKLQMDYLWIQLICPREKWSA